MKYIGTKQLVLQSMMRLDVNKTSIASFLLEAKLMLDMHKLIKNRSMIL